MAHLSLTVKDSIYTAALATMPGADDAARLVELKRLLRGAIRDQVRWSRERAAREIANAAMRDALAGLDAELAE